MYTARHVATRYYKATTTIDTDRASAAIAAAWKHIDARPGVNAQRVQRFTIATFVNVGDPLHSRCYAFVYQNNHMTMYYAGTSDLVTRC